ncbi:hypothetical protein K456DRAFT_869914 [Colletotrichum gloeosporioides 23]|nr:hypothetical protein K456DRAFT_869914 [Colletotrichum gloeosporioides 23]
MGPVKAYPTLQSRIRVFCGVVLKDALFLPSACSTNPCLPKRYGCQPCMQLPSASSDFSNTRNWVGSNAVGEKKWRRLAARLASCTNSSTRNVTFRMTTTTYTPCPLWRTCLSYIVEWASPSQERREGGLLTSNPTLRGRDGHARGPGGRRPLRLRQGVGADELQRRPTHSMQAGLTALMRLPDPARPRSLTKGALAQYRPVPALHPVPLLAPGKGRPTISCFPKGILNTLFFDMAVLLEVLDHEANEGVHCLDISIQLTRHSFSHIISIFGILALGVSLGAANPVVLGSPSVFHQLRLFLPRLVCPTSARGKEPPYRASFITGPVAIWKKVAAALLTFMSWTSALCCPDWLTPRLFLPSLRLRLRLPSPRRLRFC